MSKASKKYEELLNKLKEVTQNHYQIERKTEDLKKIHKQQVDVLETKLAESEEKYNATNRAYWELVEKQDNDFLQYEKLIGENQQLKQQLAESEKKLNQYPHKNDVIEKQYEDLKDTITFLMLNNIKDQEQLNHSIDVLCGKHKARIRDIENGICKIEKLEKQNEELTKLKIEKLYFELLFTRLQGIHKKADECREEKERFGGIEDMALDSVWRVFDLQKHECCEYEEMIALDDGIGIIAEDKLLRDIEHDLGFKATRTEKEIFDDINQIKQLKEGK